MEIRLAGVPLAVLMRTPGYDIDLVRGFALTEGIVLDPNEIASVPAIGTGDDARYELVFADGVHVDPERFRRTFYATSSCGVCGKASIDAVRVAAAAPTQGPQDDRGRVDSTPGHDAGTPGDLLPHRRNPRGGTLHPRRDDAGNPRRHWAPQRARTSWWGRSRTRTGRWATASCSFREGFRSKSCRRRRSPGFPSSPACRHRQRSPLTSAGSSACP